MNANELADAMEIRASIRRKATSRKSVQANANDRLADQLEHAATMLRQQQAEIERLIMLCDCMTTESNRKGNEIEALKELNTMLKDAIEKRIEMDANRYQWLRAEFAAGRETYLAEGIPSRESLDKYIDGKLK